MSSNRARPGSRYVSVCTRPQARLTHSCASCRDMKVSRESDFEADCIQIRCIRGPDDDRCVRCCETKPRFFRIMAQEKYALISRANIPDARGPAGSRVSRQQCQGELGGQRGRLTRRERSSNEPGDLFMDARLGDPGASGIIPPPAVRLSPQVSSAHGASISPAAVALPTITPVTRDSNMARVDVSGYLDPSEPTAGRGEQPVAASQTLPYSTSDPGETSCWHRADKAVTISIVSLGEAEGLLKLWVPIATRGDADNLATLPTSTT